MARALHPALSALLLATALSSCTTNGGNTFLVATKVVFGSGVVDPATGNCTPPVVFSASTDEALFPTFKAGTEMQLGIVVNSRLSSGTTGARFQTNDWFAERVVVSYEATGSKAVNIPERTLPAQGYVAAAGSGVALGVLISKDDSVALAALSSVRLRVHVIGKLGDGSTAQTSDYEFIAVPGSGGNCIGK